MEVIGHKKQIDFFKKISELNKLSHAYLFTGPEKIGKKKVALEWISYLFNQDIQKKHHPDLFLIEEEKEIQIGQIRELIRKLSLSPYSAPLKSAIIDNAHLMNKETQNALLKTLEEPSGKTLLILITEFPEVLFSTILSRVQKIKFSPVEKREIKEYLIKQGIKSKEIEEITELSYGKSGIVIDFILDFEKLKNRKKIIEELIILSQSNLSFRFQYVKDLFSGDSFHSGGIVLTEVLDIWLRYFREQLILEINSGKIFFDKINRFKNIIQQIQKTNFLISTTNINSRLALETLVLEF